MAQKMDPGTLAAALMGYRSQLEDVDRRIRELRARLGGRAVPASGSEKPVRKHLISPAGRARIAAAQRRRWAAMKKANAAG
jgi:hypothetical protein